MTTRIKLDHKQIANVAYLLATHGVTQLGDNVDDIRWSLYQRVAGAVNEHSNGSAPYSLSANGYAIIVWPLAAEITEVAGYTHAASVYVDAAQLLSSLNDGLTEDIMVVTAPNNKVNLDGKYVRYIHLRVYDTITDQFGNVLDEAAKQFGGITVAFVDNEDGTISYSFARCSKRDQYVKKIGNQIARERLTDIATSYTFNGTINAFRPWILDHMNAAFKP